VWNVWNKKCIRNMRHNIYGVSKIKKVSDTILATEDGPKPFK